MPRVLVTGANGFVGSAVVPLLLAAGYDVHAVVQAAGAGPAGATTHRCDLTDERAVEALCGRVRATHLLHLAWCTTLADHKTSAENLRWVAGGARLLEAFRGNGGTRVVAAGTYAEYGSFSGVCEETTPAAPAVLYTAAKWAVGSLALAYGAREGFPVSWARLFLVYGAGEPAIRLIPQAALALARGEPFAATDGRQVRDFVHVSDVAAALALLVGADHHGIANVGTGTGRSIADVLFAIAGRLQRRELVRLGAIPRSGLEPDTQIAEPATLRALGWSPQLDFEAGLGAEVDLVAAGALRS